MLPVRVNRIFFAKLAEAMTKGGQFVAIEPPLDVFHDVAFGLSTGWFDETIAEEYPVGPLRTSGDWLEQFNGTSFDAPIAIEAYQDGASVVLLSATAKPNNAELHTGKALDLPESKAVVIIAGNASLEQEIANAIKDDARLSTCNIKILNADSDQFDLNEASGWKSALAGSTVLDAELKAIIHLYGLAEAGDTPVDQVMKRCVTCVGLVKAYPGFSGQLALVTPGGSGHNSEHVSPAQSAAWMFARVLCNEAPELTPLALDVCTNRDMESIASDIVEAVFYQNAENELHLPQKSRVVSRVKSGFGQSSWEPAENVELNFSESGSLNNLSWRGQQRIHPSTDHVEIKVAATGLNFRDVMWTLGMLPEEALEDGYGGPNLGLEISGTVTRIGENVSNLAIGDKVVAFTSGGYSSYVTSPEFAVAKLDPGQDLVAAATYPVAFLTAYYSLIHLGELKEDQWVLIHGGAGGVGLAALQIAKHVGAKIIATAGSEEKREILRLLGADHILDSRSLEFPERVMDLTDGKGVHAVLNSLAGEAMESSINIVRPFGRFLELGKRDFYANTKIGLRPFRRNVSYFGIDLDQILLHDSGWLVSSLKMCSS